MNGQMVWLINLNGQDAVSKVRLPDHFLPAEVPLALSSSYTAFYNIFSGCVGTVTPNPSGSEICARIRNIASHRRIHLICSSGLCADQTYQVTKKSWKLSGRRFLYIPKAVTVSVFIHTGYMSNFSLLEFLEWVDHSELLGQISWLHFYISSMT